MDVTKGTAGGEGITLSQCRLGPWIVGLAAVLLASPAAAQGNLDAGKSPAQIFSDTCAGCHRSPGQVRRASASFLRSHYTTGSEEASSMARYLANVPVDRRPPPGQQKKNASPKETPTEAAAARRGEPKEQAKGNRRTAAEAKPAATASASASAAATPEIKPPEPPAAAPTPPPALEPFEE